MTFKNRTDYNPTILSHVHTTRKFDQLHKKFSVGVQKSKTRGPPKNIPVKCVCATPRVRTGSSRELRESGAINNNRRLTRTCPDNVGCNQPLPFPLTDSGRRDASGARHKKKNCNLGKLIARHVLRCARFFFEILFRSFSDKAKVTFCTLE